MCVVTVGAIGAVAALGSAYVGYEGMQAQKSIASTSKGMAQQTFAEQQGYEQQLSALINDPSSITKDPGYGFGLDQGSQAVARQMASSGFNNSGNQAIALTQYGQQYGFGFLKQQEDLLANLSGLTRSSATSASEAMTGPGGSSGASSAGFNELSSVLAGIGAGVAPGGSLSTAAGMLKYGGSAPAGPSASDINFNVNEAMGGFQSNLNQQMYAGNADVGSAGYLAVQ